MSLEIPQATFVSSIIKRCKQTIKMNHCSLNLLIFYNPVISHASGILHTVVPGSFSWQLPVPCLIRRIAPVLAILTYTGLTGGYSDLFCLKQKTGFELDLENNHFRFSR